MLGYWLGAELVINSTYRYVSWAATMPFAERDRLMEHVMDVDQHVRYALVLQAGLGVALVSLARLRAGRRRCGDHRGGPVGGMVVAPRGGASGASCAGGQKPGGD